MEKTPDDDGRRESRDLPTTNQPLHAAPRPLWRPLLYLLGFLVVVFLIYLFGVTVLVPAD